MKTLDESEEADRRHVANYRVQLLLAVLTLVSVVMAAAQAGLLKLPVLLDLTPMAASAPTRGAPALPAAEPPASTLRPASTTATK